MKHTQTLGIALGSAAQSFWLWKLCGRWPPETEPSKQRDVWKSINFKKLSYIAHRRRTTKHFSDSTIHAQGAFTFLHFFARNLLLTPSTRRGEQLAVLAKGNYCFCGRQLLCKLCKFIQVAYKLLTQMTQFLVS